MKSRDSKVTLREITADSVRSICLLTVAEDQKNLVTPNAISIAEAYFSDNAWFRAVYSNETPVGFVMLDADTSKPEYFLWRFMIAAEYQGYGIGRKAIALLTDHVRTRPGAIELFTSVVQTEGGPQPFYEKQGFKLTGDYEEEEAVMVLPLT